ncbi:MAG: radical SAM protein [Desulfovibrio sp.]|nr:radical SAM protein [Desulfovibrio sp.]
MFFECEGLDHQGFCFRPPSEAYSILFQATLGCSHNKCSFCSAFKEKRFAIKDRNIWEKDLKFAEKYCRGQTRLFVMDGDALIMPMRHWEWLLSNISERLPWVERVSTYGNAKGVALKSDEDLRRLREMGLSLIYYGIESGHPEVLKDIKKGSTPEKLVEQALRLKKAGFALSVTVILGLAGMDKSREHAIETGRVLSAIDPEYVGALSLMLSEDAPIYERVRSGELVLPEGLDFVQELGLMFANTRLSGGWFMANHASNYLTIRAHLPEDREKTLQRINAALDGRISLRKEWMRAL